jgi:hypothetical protein
LGYSLRNSSALFCFNYGSGKFYLKVIIWIELILYESTEKYKLIIITPDIII